MIIFAVTENPSSDPAEAAAGHLETVADAFPDEAHTHYLVSSSAGLQELRDQLLAFGMAYDDTVQLTLADVVDEVPPVSMFSHRANGARIGSMACQDMVNSADRADQDRKQLSTMQPYEWAKFMRLLRTAARHNGMQIFETTAQTVMPSSNKRSKQHDAADAEGARR